MPEFVADGSDAVEFCSRGTFELVAAGIFVDDDSIELEGTSRSPLYGPLMRPNGVVASSLGFSVTGINHVTEVDDSVFVAVVDGVVYIPVGKPACFCYQLGGSLVVAFFVIPSVVGHLVHCIIRAIDVKLRLEKAVALCDEVVSCAAEARSFVVVSVDMLRYSFPRVSSCKLHIGELYEDNEHTLGSNMVFASGAFGAVAGTFASSGDFLLIHLHTQSMFGLRFLIQR